MKFLISVLITSLFFSNTLFGKELQDGDIIFHTSKSSQSLAIQRATDSKYSHMGIVFFREGEPYVLEASKTVRYTPLQQWIMQGVDKHYIVKRLNNADDLLSSGQISKLKLAAEEFLGRSYDVYFNWSDEKIYCSELVWKAYNQVFGIEIGGLQTLKEFNLDDQVVQKKLVERYGDNIPFDEIVISPSAMFESKYLYTVELD